MKETMKFEFYAEVDPKTGPEPDTVVATRRHLKGRGAARFVLDADTGKTALIFSTCIEGESSSASLHYEEDELRTILAEGAGILQQLEARRREALKPVARKRTTTMAATKLKAASSPTPKSNVVPLRRGSP